MSGGSYNYAYRHIEEMAESIENSSKNDALRLAFAKHLRLIAKACHDIEWVDSGDYGQGDEVAAITATLENGGIDVESQSKALAYDEIHKWFLSRGEPVKRYFHINIDSLRNIMSRGIECKNPNCFNGKTIAHIVEELTPSRRGR